MQNTFACSALFWGRSTTRSTRQVTRYTLLQFTITKSPLWTLGHTSRLEKKLGSLAAQALGLSFAVTCVAVGMAM